MRAADDASWHISARENTGAQISRVSCLDRGTEKVLQGAACHGIWNAHLYFAERYVLGCRKAHRFVEQHLAPSEISSRGGKHAKALQSRIT